MTEYLVISIDNCPFCEKAKALLTEKEISYAEVNCADIPEIAEVLHRVGHDTFPLILRTIGGFTDLERIFK